MTNADLFDNQSLSDIKLIIKSVLETKEIYLNKCILATNSDFFRSLFFGSLSNVNEECILEVDDPIIFCEIIKHVYYQTKNLPTLSYDNAIIWNKIVDQFLFTNLIQPSKELILTYLPTLDRERWVNLLVYSFEDDKLLYTKVLPHIKRHWDKEIAGLLRNHPDILIDTINLFIVSEDDDE